MNSQKLGELVGQYGVQCAKTAELAPTKELADAIGALDDESELHIMRLAAISTATFANTPETHAQSVGRDNPYWTQAYQDVVDLVSREIDLRAQLAAEKEARERAEKDYAVQSELLTALRAELRHTIAAAESRQQEAVAQALQDVIGMVKRAQRNMACRTVTYDGSLEAARCIQVAFRKAGDELHLLEDCVKSLSPADAPARVEANRRDAELLRRYIARMQDVRDGNSLHSICDDLITERNAAIAAKEGA